MKKIFLLFAMAGAVALTGCDSNDDDVAYQDYDTYPVAFELSNVDLTFEPATGRFEYLTVFDDQLYPADVVLVYRRTAEGNFMVWQQIPRTLYLDAGDEVDYDFNFTRDDILVYADANFDLITDPTFIDNQTFRVVLVPADFLAGSRLDLNDYDAVMNRLNIKETDVKVLNK